MTLDRVMCREIPESKEFHPPDLRDGEHHLELFFDPGKASNGSVQTSMLEVIRKVLVDDACNGGIIRRALPEEVTTELADVSRVELNRNPNYRFVDNDQISIEALIKISETLSSMFNCLDTCTSSILEELSSSGFNRPENFTPEPEPRVTAIINTDTFGQHVDNSNTAQIPRSAVFGLTASIYLKGQRRYCSMGKLPEGDNNRIGQPPFDKFNPIHFSDVAQRAYLPKPIYQDVGDIILLPNGPNPAMHRFKGTINAEPERLYEGISFIVDFGACTYRPHPEASVYYPRRSL